MKFPFYRNEDKTYTIDDANYDCGRIIISDCSGGHRYASLCELIEDCPGIKQLTRPCIVEALNDLQKLGTQSGLDPKKRFLKIGSDGCLEVANPCICNEGDRLVVATDEDNDPGPLSTKVRGSCSDDGLYCIDIEVGGPKTLVWRPSGPNGPFINPDLPNCPDADEAYVKLKKQGGKRVVDYKCEDINSAPEHLYATHKGGKGAVNSYRKAMRYYATLSGNPIPSDPTCSYIDGGRQVIGSDAFGPGKGYGVFQILKPGVYTISFSAYLEAGYYTSNVVNAIRCGLYMSTLNSATPTSFSELGDFKYEFGEGFDRKSGSGDFNRMHPETWNYNAYFSNRDASGHLFDGLSADMSGFPFARTYTLNVQTPIEIAFRVGVDMRYIDTRWKNVDPEDFNVRIAANQELHDDDHSARCRIDCTRIGDAVLNDRMHRLVP